MFRASSSTRMLKPSQEISRLMKRSGESIVMAGGAIGSCSFMAAFRRRWAETCLARHYNSGMTVR